MPSKASGHCEWRSASVRNARRGFTLVEMLIVSALIALFAGLAVINLQTQLNINKQKAAIAECRQIATAMTFARNDTSIYPKICFLNFGRQPLLLELDGKSQSGAVGFDAIDYYGYNVAGLRNLIDRRWTQYGGYAGFSGDRTVDMRFNTQGSAGRQLNYRWPADPWNRPYVAYLLAATQDLNKRARFVKDAGENPDFKTCIVSYGRNGVAGGVDGYQNDDGARANRLGARLYYDFETDSVLGKGQFRLPDVGQFAENSAFSNQALNYFSAPDTPGQQPSVTGGLSDDRIYEF